MTVSARTHTLTNTHTCPGVLAVRLQGRDPVSSQGEVKKNTDVILRPL